MKRKAGYYFVKIEERWFIGVYKDNCYWDILGDNYQFNKDDYEDDEFSEIDENLIVLPDSIERNKNNSDPKTIEAITGLIRYGYQEAIDEIREYLIDEFSNREPNLLDLSNKLLSMENTKKQINLDKLSKEIPE